MRKLKRNWHRVFLLLGAALAGCGDQHHPAVVEQSTVHLIEPMQVQEASLEQVYRVPGNVTADDSIQLSSRITGFIQSVAVREGDRVSQGGLLPTQSTRRRRRGGGLGAGRRAGKCLPDRFQ